MSEVFWGGSCLKVTDAEHSLVWTPTFFRAEAPGSTHMEAQRRFVSRGQGELSRAHFAPLIMQALCMNKDFQSKLCHLPKHSSFFVTGEVGLLRRETLTSGSNLETKIQGSAPLALKTSWVESLDHRFSLRYLRPVQVLLQVFKGFFGSHLKPCTPDGLSRLV